MFTGQCQYLPFGSCSPISTCTDLQDEKSLLLHSDFFSTYYKQFKVCSLLFSPSLIKIISNCHEMWMGNCACKIQWGLNPDCGRLQVPVLYFICPPQKFLHFQLFGMSTAHLNPNGACDNNSVIFMAFLHFHCYRVSRTWNLFNYS